jgi:hypothetical protein
MTAVTASIILRTPYTTEYLESPRLFQDHFINSTEWFRGTARAVRTGVPCGGGQRGARAQVRAHTPAGHDAGGFSFHDRTQLTHEVEGLAP